MTENQFSNKEQPEKDLISVVERTMSTDWLAMLKSLRKDKSRIERLINKAKEELVKLHTEQNRNAASDAQRVLLDKRIECLLTEIEANEAAVQRTCYEMENAKKEKAEQDRRNEWVAKKKTFASPGDLSVKGW